jgi:hypothetical protein
MEELSFQNTLASLSSSIRRWEGKREILEEDKSIGK